MPTRLSRIGDDPALVLDGATWKVSGIDGENDLEVEVDARGIHIRPKPDEHRERILGSAWKIMDAHEETFQKLAR